jgi:hypothetical protein
MELCNAHARYKSITEGYWTGMAAALTPMSYELRGSRIKRFEQRRMDIDNLRPYPFPCDERNRIWKECVCDQKL